MNNDINGFLEELASNSPTPGGGGASSLAGAVGVALASMVANLTTGKKKYAQYQQDIDVILWRAEELRKTLVQQIDDDAAAFEPLAKAYAIPKDAPERESVMEECLRAAAAPPFRILGLCGEALDLLAEFAEKGSAIVISDAACGAAFCRSAMQGAAVNVRINTKTMRDRGYAEALEKKAGELLAHYLPLADRIYEKAAERIG